MSPQFWQAFLAAEMPPQKGRALLDALGSSISDPLEYLRRWDQLSPGEKRRMSFDPGLDKALAAGIQVLEEREYPPLLAGSPGVSPAQMFHGDLAAFDQPCVAIVGTRSATTYGKACAQKFAEALARAGATIVSGGALGIDAAAHKGALAVGGRSIAVLAGGVENVYPAVHDRLFSDLRERGGLLSQFAIGSRPNEYKFLVRNELIAALSAAVVVIEAPGRSGAIKTAVSGAEMGREVFVVPGNIDMLSFRGSFNLIRDGATLVDHPDQVIEAIGLQPMSELTLVPDLSDLGQKIVAALNGQPLSAEKIVQTTGLGTSEVLSELTMLELDGLVIRDSGGYALRP